MHEHHRNRIPGAVFAAIVCLSGGAATAEPSTNAEREASFKETLARIESKRKTLFERYRKASPKRRAAIREEARTVVVDAIVNDIVPFWIGTPWTMAVVDDGLKPNAAHPFEKGKGISCSWFLVSVLRNAGLKFINPRQFAGTISIHFQYALSPNRGSIRRLYNKTPKQLKKKMIESGDGLYVIGLNCHIGFVHVSGNAVRFIHSSYFSPSAVVIEPIEKSLAIVSSESAGFVVSPLFKDVRLIEHWLSGQKVPFQKLNKKGRKP